MRRRPTRKLIESGCKRGNRSRSPGKRFHPQNVEIPKRWLSKLYKSIDMYPFLASLGDTQAIIPVDERGKVDLDSAQEEFGWGHLEEIYRRHRGKGRNTPKTLTQQIDFANKLSSQPLLRISDRCMVLHVKFRRYHARRSNLSWEAVSWDHTLYWHVASSSATRAAYLTALLNAPCLRRAFFESRESGRHFQLHPGARFPSRDMTARTERHAELARLCGVAEKAALEIARRLSAPRTPSAGQNKLSQA